MRITEIESIILQHDMQEELEFAQGYYDKRTAHLVRVHTDEGSGSSSTRRLSRNIEWVSRRGRS